MQTAACKQHISLGLQGWFLAETPVNELHTVTRLNNQTSRVLTASDMMTMRYIENQHTHSLLQSRTSDRPELGSYVASAIGDAVMPILYTSTSRILVLHPQAVSEVSDFLVFALCILLMRNLWAMDMPLWRLSCHIHTGIQTVLGAGRLCSRLHSKMDEAWRSEEMHTPWAHLGCIVGHPPSSHGHSWTAKKLESDMKLREHVYNDLASQYIECCVGHSLPSQCQTSKGHFRSIHATGQSTDDKETYSKISSRVWRMVSINKWSYLSYINVHRFRLPWLIMRILDGSPELMHARWEQGTYHQASLCRSGHWATSSASFTPHFDYWFITGQYSCVTCYRSAAQGHRSSSSCWVYLEDPDLKGTMKPAEQDHSGYL